MDSSGGGSSYLEELAELVAAQQVLIDQLTTRVTELQGSPFVAIQNLSGPQVRINEGSDDDPERVAVPDEAILHVPTVCDSCGRDLAEADVVGTDIHRVIELPKNRISVIDHVAEVRRCEVGHATRAAFPANASEPISYGAGIRALATYFTVYQRLPLDQTAQIFSDVFGRELSLKTLAELVSETRTDLEGPQSSGPR